MKRNNNENNRQRALRAMTTRKVIRSVTINTEDLYSACLEERGKTAVNVIVV